MPEKNKELVETSALNFTWYTGIIAIVAPLGAALIGLLGPLKDQPPSTVVAIFAAIAAGLLAAAIAAAADVLARAWVTVADKRSLSTSSGENAAKAASTLGTTAVSFEVCVDRLSARPLKVLAVRWDDYAGEAQYLVGERGASPQWAKQAEVHGLDYSDD